jgi:hypothetical protein
VKGNEYSDDSATTLHSIFFYFESSMTGFNTEYSIKKLYFILLYVGPKFHIHYGYLVSRLSSTLLNK